VARQNGLPSGLSSRFTVKAEEFILAGILKLRDPGEEPALKHKNG